MHEGNGRIKEGIVMSLTVKDNYILAYYSEWIIANKDDWHSLYEAIDCGNFVFESVCDGKDIKNQFVYFLKWLIESANQVTNSFSGNETSCSQILIMVKEKKQLLLSDFPVIEPKKENWNVDDIKSTVYGLYNQFFELVRQLEVMLGMSEKAIVCYKKHCQELSSKVRDYSKSYDGGKIRQAIREVNGKLDWSKRIDIDDLRNFVNQIQGWLEERLFAFGDSLIPYQYLSVDDLFRDLDFQYNYLKSKSKALSLSYPESVEPLVSVATKIWEQFQKFYSDISLLNSRFAPTKVIEDFPIRTLFLLGRIPEMIESIRAVFASVPSIIFKNPGMQESHFHIAMHTMFKALKLKPFSEQAMSGGRSDMLVEKTESFYVEVKNGSPVRVNKKVLYILEFKISETSKDESDKALDQIKRKDYGLAYKDDYHKVYGIGLCFSTKERNIFKNKYEPELLYEDGKCLFDVPE